MAARRAGRVGASFGAVFVFNPRLRQCQGSGVVDVVDQGHGHAVDGGQALGAGGQQYPGGEGGSPSEQADPLGAPWLWYLECLEAG